MTRATPGAQKPDVQKLGVQKLGVQKPGGPKKVFIRTYGCQMNVYDSSRMADVLAPLGYGTTDQPEDADMVILNTCHIREKAAEKVFSDLGRLRPLKQARVAGGGEMIIAVAGCVAQAEGAEIMARAPFVDIVVGPQAYHRLPDMIGRTQAKQRVIDTEFPVDSKFDLLPTSQAGGVTALLSVQEGCDKFCTFCVVPYTRGAEYSRPAHAILAEARGLVARGAREITLLGQNVNAYHGAAHTAAGEESSDLGWSLGRLIRALAEVEGLVSIRYMTSHPRDMDDALMTAHRDVPQLMPFLHLPVQSGSDSILKTMNRGHSRDDYRRVVEKLRSYRPDMALSSDFIVGFPGESDQDFAETLSLVEEISFAQAFTFKYSPRPGTPASVLESQIPEDVKTERLTELQALVARQQRAFNTASVGCVFDVLLTGPGRHPGQLVGRSPYLQAVHVTAPEHLVGTVASLEITSLETNSLSAVLAGAPTLSVAHP